MDSRKDILKSITWEIECGSLVKVRRYSFDGSLYYQHGIVVSRKQIDQLEMFPYVEVYTFETQKITKQSPAALEVLSKPSDEKS
tara:strand:- start:1023 stop:1274 length:252 start_codon:yes stop_codon:yes gene_type:complete